MQPVNADGMTPARRASPLRLLLVGAGHAHLGLLAGAVRLRAAGISPMLVCPAQSTYSGLASAVLSGALPASAARMDVAALAAERGVVHLPGVVAHLDREAKVARLHDGAVLPFDVVSLNIGSEAADPAGLLGSSATWGAKPLEQWQDLRAFVEGWIGSTGAAPAVVVAGAGATAHEAAGALAGLMRRCGVAPRVTLAGPAPAGWAPPSALASLRAGLVRRGVALREQRVASRASGSCRLADGQLLPCDALLVAAGLRAPGLAAASGLPVDALGRVRTAPALHAIDGTDVFAAGDCAVVEGDGRPMLGVFGVRAAGLLAANLAALAAGRAMAPFRAQRRWLSILDLGDGSGMAIRGRLWWQGRAALRVKRLLDRRHMRRNRACHAA